MQLFYYKYNIGGELYSCMKFLIAYFKIPPFLKYSNSMLESMRQITLNLIPLSV